MSQYRHRLLDERLRPEYGDNRGLYGNAEDIIALPGSAFELRADGQCAAKRLLFDSDTYIDYDRVDLHVLYQHPTLISSFETNSRSERLRPAFNIDRRHSLGDGCDSALWSGHDSRLHRELGMA